MKLKNHHQTNDLSFDEELLEEVFQAFQDDVRVKIVGKTFPVKNLDLRPGPFEGDNEHMTNDTQQIVNKAWNFAHVLRDDGLSYMAYTEQITFLLFLQRTGE